MDNKWIEYTDDYDTIPSEHRIAIKTPCSTIYDVFFIEYVEPVIVVKKNKRKKKYDISNSTILLYYIDETKEIIDNVNKFIEKMDNSTTNININSQQEITISTSDISDYINGLLIGIVNSAVEKSELKAIISRYI